MGYNRWAGNISLMDRTWIPCAALKKHGSQQFLWSHKGLPSFAIESGLKALALGPSVLRILHTAQVKMLKNHRINVNLKENHSRSDCRDLLVSVFRNEDRKLWTYKSNRFILLIGCSIPLHSYEIGWSKTFFWKYQVTNQLLFSIVLAKNFFFENNK